MSPHTILRALMPADFSWPDDADAASDSLEANHDYMPDIRFARWADVEHALSRESEVLPLLKQVQNPEAEWESQRDRIAAESAEIADDFLVALDPGVASATLALAAMGCLPFWSCNGGALGGDHASGHPIVQFFARPEHAPVLLKCAEQANVGLSQDEDGRCSVVAEDIDAMRAFAKALSDAELREHA